MGKSAAKVKASSCVHKPAGNSTFSCEFMCVCVVSGGKFAFFNQPGTGFIGSISTDSEKQDLSVPPAPTTRRSSSKNTAKSGFIYLCVRRVILYMYLYNI